MIGLNNDDRMERFDITDAGQLADWAAENQIGLLGMWSANRDHPCPDTTSVQLDCSSVPEQMKDWLFTETLASFGP